MHDGSSGPTAMASPIRGRFTPVDDEYTEASMTFAESLPTVPTDVIVRFRSVDPYDDNVSGKPFSVTRKHSTSWVRISAIPSITLSVMVEIVCSVTSAP